MTVSKRIKSYLKYMAYTYGIYLLLNVLLSYDSWHGITKYRPSVNPEHNYKRGANSTNIGRAPRNRGFRQYIHRFVEYDSHIPKPSRVGKRNTVGKRIQDFQCNGSAVVYNRTLFVFRNAVLLPWLVQGLARGGASLDNLTLVNQTEEKEYVNVSRGFLQIHCPNATLDLEQHGKMQANVHARAWIKSMTTIDDDDKAFDIITNINKRVHGLTVLVERYEYANVYWTVMDAYDVFRASYMLNHNPSNTSIIIFDAHPQSSLDALWECFGSVERIQAITKATQFELLTWRYNRKYSPFLKQLKAELPLIHEFRSFVLSSITHSPPAPPTCSRLRLLLIWRHDYKAHPRNPSGHVSRKIANEEELLNSTRATFPQYTVQGVQLDAYNVSTQLTLVANTDLLIGMHGAAMAFSVFLPPGGAVVELYPGYYLKPNWHMSRLAEGSGHGYFTKTLSRALGKGTTTTYVPPQTLCELVKQAAAYVCQSSGRV